MHIIVTEHVNCFITGKFSHNSDEAHSANCKPYICTLSVLKSFYRQIFENVKFNYFYYYIIY